VPASNLLETPTPGPTPSESLSEPLPLILVGSANSGVRRDRVTLTLGESVC
jgi:hypothetical protein